MCVVTPEIIERVDAWIGARVPDATARWWRVPDGSGDPLVWLVNDWRRACTLWRYRRAKDPGDASGAVASAQAAMTGLLLALARKAWDSPDMQPEYHDGIWCIRRLGSLIAGPNGTAFFIEAEALVVALEAAPRREGS